MTSNAKQIYSTITHSTQHMTADEIFLELRKNGVKMSLATVYNNLNKLFHEGHIEKVSIEGYPDRYDRIHRHDHLICKKCGKLTDISLEDLTEKLRQQVDVDIISYDLKVNYLCKDCSNKST